MSTAVGPEEVEVGAPGELFALWEHQSWSSSAIVLDEDVEQWPALGRFARQELEAAIGQLHHAEEAVASTLAPICGAAPTREDQQYLSSQLADEARHTRFFDRYRQTVMAASSGADETPQAFARLFDDELARRTEAVRVSPGDERAWYEAVTLYHLIAEGVLALGVLRPMLAMLRELDRLPALATGVTNVLRDEVRHVRFGIHALRRGVATGQRDAIETTVAVGVPLVARVLVDPERRVAGATLPAARQIVGTRLEDTYMRARERLARRLRAVGLDDLVEREQGSFDGALAGAYRAYEELHGAPHPAAWVAAGG